MPGRAAGDIKIPRYAGGGCTSGNRFGRGYIYAHGRNEGGGEGLRKRCIVFEGEEAFGDLALSDLAEDDSLQTR